MQSSNENDANEFSILHWNILDPDFCKPSDFPKTAPEFLTWEFRKEKIEEIVRQKNPDLICFVETKPDEKFDFGTQKKYESIYLEKNGLSHGNLLLFNAEIFQLESKHFEFFLNEEGKKASQNFICLKLLHKPSKNFVHFLATHLKSKNFKERRFLSVKRIVDFLADEKIVDNFLIVGDFNAEENEESMLFLREKIELFSVREKQITTFKFYAASFFKMVKRKIDYVFFHEKSFQILQDWSLNEKAEQIETGCPSQICPSDHLPIFALLRLKSNKNEEEKEKKGEKEEKEKEEEFKPSL